MAPADQPSPPRRRWRRLLKWSLPPLLVLGAVFAVVKPAVDKVRQAAARTQST